MDTQRQRTPPDSFNGKHRLPSSRSSRTEEKFFEPKVPRRVSMLSISPNGRWGAIGYESGSIRQLNIETREADLFAKVDSHQISGIDCYADASIVAAGASNGQVYLFRDSDGQSLGVLRGHTASLTDLDISPDGKRMASASEDRTIRIWDLTNREMMAVLSGHWARIHRVAWSPDGATLASCGEDGQLRLWRTE